VSRPATITTSDGLDLEARWDLPEGAPHHAVVLCHPHPLMGGSLDAPLLRAAAAGMAEAGIAVLRFNFRGVGRSEGGWSGGNAEIEDVAAAVAAAGAAHPRLPQGIAGWSFGAHTGLRWQARSGDGRPFAGIAPPVQMTGGLPLPAPEALAPARRLLVIGDRDQLVSPEEVRAYAAEIGAAFEVVAGSDHFFHFREQKVAGLLAAHFSEPE
jgi:alpha/beta superfamily hydrolase